MRFVKHSSIIQLVYDSAIRILLQVIFRNVEFRYLCYGLFTRQIATGLLLVMHYIPSTDLAFSYGTFKRDVNFGWLLR